MSKKNKSLSGKDLFIIAICLFVLNGLLYNVLSGVLGDAVSVALTVGAFVCLVSAPIVLIKNRGKQNKLSRRDNDKHDSKAVDEYAATIIGVSLAASKELAKPLSVSANQSHRLLNEAFGFSMFMTSAHLQSQNVSHSRIDDIIENLSNSLASQMSEIANTTHSEALNQIIMTGQHFYQDHKPLNIEDSGELLQKIAISYLKEYRPKDYKDFFAMTEVAMTLGNIGEQLNKSGFAERQKN